MRKLSWLIVGVALGFIGAHFVNQTPGGRRFFDQVGRGVQEFGDAIAEGYRVADQELTETLDDVKRRLTKLEANN